MTNAEMNRAAYQTAVKLGWTQGPSKFWKMIRSKYRTDLSQGMPLHKAATRFTGSSVDENRNSHPQTNRVLYQIAVKKGWTQGPSKFWEMIRSKYRTEILQGMPLYEAALKFIRHCM